MKWLLIPGWGLDAASLAPLAQALGGDVCLAPAPGSLDWPEYRACLIRLGQGRIWVGHSLGGMAAIRAAAGARAVVTLCANASFIERPQWSTALTAAALAQFDREFQQDARRAWPRFLALGSRGDAAARACVNQLPGPAAGWQRGLEWLAQFDNRAALAQLALPQLHLFAAGDALVPVAAAGQFQQWPAAHTEVIAAASHWLPLTHAVPLARRLRVFAEQLPPEPDRVARDFGRASATYDSAARVQLRAAERLAALAQALPQPRLDVGAGTGLLSRAGAGPMAVALDISPAMLIAARAHGGAAPGVAATAAALPFADASFGAVLSSFMLQWCPELDPVIAEMARVLAPGGALLVAAPGPRSLAALRRAGLPEAARWISPEQLAAAAERAGLTVQLLETQMETEWLPDARALITGFKTIGAQRKAAGGGLGGRARIAALLTALAACETTGGIAAEYEVVTLMATRK